MDLHLLIVDMSKLLASLPQILDHFQLKAGRQHMQLIHIFEQDIVLP